MLAAAISFQYLLTTVMAMDETIRIFIPEDAWEAQKDKDSDKIIVKFKDKGVIIETTDEMLYAWAVTVAIEAVQDSKWFWSIIEPEVEKIAEKIKKELQGG